jgi:putative flippase GtrA
MSLGRHAKHYFLIGMLQWLIDWGVMVALTHWIPVEPANVGGRVAGALLGFWLNGRVTFAGEDTAVGHAQLRRYLVMWTSTTIASTWAMGAIDNGLGLQWARLGKPAVELVLGAVGFVLSRHWNYKK